MAIGAYRGVIPVVMQEVREPDLPPREPAPECGSRWGKPSTFQKSVTEPPADDPDGPIPPPAEIVETEVRHIVEIEELPNGEQAFQQMSVSIGGYVRDAFLQLPSGTGSGSAIPNGPFTYDRLRELIDCDLGTETWQEISGYTAFADGHVQERYKQVEVKRLITFTFLQ